MRITILQDATPVTVAVARDGGSDDRAIARVAARAAQGAHRGAVARVSLTHRDGRGAAAVAPAGVRVGVDLERTGTVPLERERFFATVAERSAPRRPRDGAVLWSLKEAAWKAFGCERSLPFGALELELDRLGRVAAVRVEGRRHVASARVRRPWQGWVLALVWAEEGA